MKAVLTKEQGEYGPLYRLAVGFSTSYTGSTLLYVHTDENYEKAVREALARKMIDEILSQLFGPELHHLLWEAERELKAGDGYTYRVQSLIAVLREGPDAFRKNLAELGLESNND